MRWFRWDRLKGLFYSGGNIGFTIRVGGRGSKIDDRRNWDSYYVDGQVKQLGVKQGKKMQGFQENYEFPVSKTQAIKQLGNSVAIDAIQEVANQMLNHLKSLENSTLTKPKMKETKNKGEWTSQKSDIVLDINNDEIEKQNEGFGIKSYLGSKPTLLNASGNTNFIFEIKGLNQSKIDEVN